MKNSQISVLHSPNITVRAHACHLLQLKPQNETLQFQITNTYTVEKEPILKWNLLVEKVFLTYQISAFLPYPSPLITSGLIQYGVPVTDFIPVPERQMVCSRLLAPKSPSFTLPAESRRIFAPGRKGIQHYIHERLINILVWSLDSVIPCKISLVFQVREFTFSAHSYYAIPRFRK